MEIILANYSGFCFGVKEAIEKTFQTTDNTDNKKTFTYGPLIHNKQVTERLSNMGIKSIEDLDIAKKNRIIIRSHGVPLDIYQQAGDLQIEILDATCPFVKKVQKIAREYYDKGYRIIIVGDPKHPEVIGINGWCDNNAYIIQDVSDIELIKHWEKICVVAQTTITEELWKSVIRELEKRAIVLEKFNTICSATRQRQSSCEEVAKQVDAMIVIGGYHSSNTQKLVQISKKYCSNTYHIETAEELPISDMKNFKKVGITAGASTPDWIIKEVIDKMSHMEQSNNEMMNMMEEIENSLRVPRRGEITKGKVIHVTDNEITVNINYKSDGIIPKDEISNDPSIDPREIVKEGDEIEVMVLKSDDGEGNVLLSKKRIATEKGWENLESLQNEGKYIEAKVLEVVKGGVIAVYNEIRGFIPASQLSNTFVKDLQEFVNKKLKVKIIDLNASKKKAVFSHRVVLEEENSNRRNTLWQNITKGSVVEGEVKRIANFGAFVDIGGIDGLIHISDLSWGRVNHPSEVVNVGDKVNVFILDYDKEKQKISLSLKQMKPQPWETVNERLNVGDIIEGKVVRLTDFGAFVEIEPGLDGLVHISQISDKHIAKPSQEVHIGQRVRVKILEINKESKRISLSIKEAKEEETNLEIELPKIEENIATIGEIFESKE